MLTQPRTHTTVVARGGTEAVGRVIATDILF